jgi:hypothetical protein
VRALAGFLTIDVTGMLQNELDPQLAEVARQIDRQLPNLRPEAEKGWAQALAPRELPLGTCFVLQPQGVVQGPVEPSTETLHARFALLASPELRTRCGEPVPATSLPPLQSDMTLPSEGVVHFGMVTALSNLARGFEAAPPAAFRDERVRVSQAAVTAWGSDVRSELTLAGGVCGTVTLDARLAFEGDAQFIGIAAPRWQREESARIADRELEPGELANALSKLPRVAPLLSASALQAAARLRQRPCVIGPTGRRAGAWRRARGLARGSGQPAYHAAVTQARQASLSSVALACTWGPAPCVLRPTVRPETYLDPYSGVAGNATVSKTALAVAVGGPVIRDEDDQTQTNPGDDEKAARGVFVRKAEQPR